MDWVREQGIKMVAVSDMYFFSDLLCELLGRKGLLHYFEHVYVSADTQEGKYTGKLFRLHVASAKRVQGRWFTLATTRFPTGAWRAKKVCKGCGCTRKDLRRRERLALSASMAQRGGIWTGRHFFDTVQTRIQ